MSTEELWKDTAAKLQEVERLSRVTGRYAVAAVVLGLLGLVLNVVAQLVN